MQVNWWAVLLLISLSDCSLGKKKSAQLEIITEYPNQQKPEHCPYTAQSGDTLLVHYVGALENGQVFDTSKREGRTPFELVLGKGSVIRGWEEGLIGICQGEKRRLIIPPHLGYGDRGMPPHIPEKATLIFSVECLQLTKVSMFSITDEQKQLLMYTGIFLVALLFVYEMYQRATKTEPKKKSTREHPNRKKGKKS